ncbi:hypothetical protein [Roseivivax sp. THAF30]|uniref:hypothetical protein n=1 Tax=Roseivivax sp. THAF30 TaxID=2587852 RepID=UPI0012698755|nr:hypothetical protein [Roseivivax sp. THAF30]QFT62069.1 hypothetical protein FIU91_03935 [Roseivivax sp. THAF30]
MNDWGIPDWTDPLAYGDTEGWHLWRWRWEFYRRREDLRKDYMENLEQAYRNDLWLRDKLKDTKIIFGQVKELGDRSFKVPAPGCDEKYGYPALPHPAYGDHPIVDICPIRDRDEDVGLVSGEWFDDGIGTIGIQPNEMAIVFKLDKPLSAQLKAAKEELSRQQRVRSSEGRTVRKTRPSPADRLAYLRILDARADMPEAKWREFTDALFAHGLVDRRKDPAGGYCAPPPQAGRDRWESANDLRFDF